MNMQGRRPARCPCEQRGPFPTWLSRSRHALLRHVSTAFLLLAILALAFPSAATDYFISSSGSDANSGTSAPVAWYSFDHAIAQLQPGDTLILVDGTYTRATTGLPIIDCDPYSGNANNGIAGSPITIKAQNERMAHLDSALASDPTHRAFTMKNCSYWNVEGLHIEGEKNTSGGAHLATIVGSDHVELRRLLLHGSNTCTNSQLLSIHSSDTVLVEESELYAFHRHGVQSFHSTNVTYRRNYANGDNGLDTCPPYWETGVAGHEPFSFYPADYGIMENNIAEDSNTALTGHASNEVAGLDPVGLHGNLWAGNIGINNFRGIALDGRCWEAPTGSCPWVNEAVDNHVENNVFYFDKAVGYGQFGISINAQIGFTALNNSILGSMPISMARGVQGAVGGLHFYKPGEASAIVENTLVTESVSYGLDLAEYDSLATLSVDVLNIFDNRDTPIAYPASVASAATTTNPDLGGCIVYIPASSPMSGAGVGGEDIGANVLYRYQDGELTDETLWDVTTGAFPCGALVPGVNDVAGESCFDVHERLHVNYGGCSLPVGYDSDADGMGDRGDNCSLLANPDQADDDADGFGNLCDCDLDQDGDCSADDVNYVNKDLCVQDPTFVHAILNCPIYLANAGDSDPSGYDTDLNNDGATLWNDVVAIVAARNANGQLPGPGKAGFGDFDLDGVADYADNCSETPNSSQLDEDFDEFGNACDCDYDNNDVCNWVDGIIHLNDFCHYHPTYDDGVVDCTQDVHPLTGYATDMNGDGTVDTLDGDLFHAANEDNLPGPGAVEIP